MKHIALLCAVLALLAGCAGSPGGPGVGDPANPGAAQAPRSVDSGILQPKVDWSGQDAPAATGLGHAGHNHGTPTAGEVTYTCPMHPQIRQKGPGSCPICGMNLVPAKDEGGANHVH